MAWEPSEDLDQPENPPGQFRDFNDCMTSVWTFPKVHTDDLADVQAGARLCLARMSILLVSTFCNSFPFCSQTSTKPLYVFINFQNKITLLKIKHVRLTRCLLYLKTSLEMK